MASPDHVKRYEHLLERISTAYRSQVLAMCKKADLTAPQFWALKTIQEMDRTKMSPLADSLCLSLGAASTLVDRLVTRGLVERATDAQDRRAVHVSVSPKGAQVLAEVVGAKSRIMQQVSEQLPEDIWPVLLAGLEALAVAWESLPPQLGVGDICIPES